MRKRTIVPAALTAVCTTLGAVALSVSTALPAHADYAPNANDVVGVGSDALQYVVDFGADGDPSGDTGYNSAGNLFKLISLDATPDSNARAAYLNNSTTASPLPQNPTTVIRAGTFPVQRPSGGSAGVSALLADTAITDPHVDFARTPTAPTTAQGAQAVTNGWQGLQVFTLGTDHLQVAAASASTNAPAGLSAQQLVAIYQCTDTKWNQVGGLSTNTIVPIIPPTGAGTRSTFLNDLKAANGGVAITLGSCVITGEQNDPTAITSNATPADAIEPFFKGRLNLWQGKSGNTTFGSNPGVGYFHDPTVAYPGGAALSPGVKLLTGTPSDSNPLYDDNASIFITYRWTDQISTTPWQPGGALNWAQTLFCDPGGPTPFFQTAAGKTLLAEAGVDPASQSCLTSPLT